MIAVDLVATFVGATIGGVVGARASEWLFRRRDRRRSRRGRVAPLPEARVISGGRQ